MNRRPAVRALCLVTLALAVPAPVAAFPLRVLAASELRIDPRLSADRSVLTLRVRLQDDRGAPLRDRSVTLVVSVDGAVTSSQSLRVGDDGELVHDVPVSRGERVVEATVSWVGDGVTAPQQRSIRVALHAPYITADVIPPPGGVELGAPDARFVVALRVGEVVDFSPRGQAVEVREGERVLASGVADASGRATLRVPTTMFAQPRVYRVRAVTSVDGERVEGPVRDLLVRVRTALSLVRADDGDNGAGVALRGTLLTVTRAPVVDAPVRVMRGTVSLAGARTDARGDFTVRLGAEVLAEHGVSVRAVFEPPEPWYGGSESPSVALTGEAPPRIHRAWVLAPAGLAAAVALAALLRARLRGERPRADVPATDATPVAEGIEQVSSSVTGALRVRFVVSDRATAQRIPGAAVRWGASPEWRELTGESVTLQPARKVEFEVGASGYAPRRVTGEFSRPGEYVVRVQLRTWREELFERARPWLKRVGASGAMPTLREALKTRAATPAALAFVEHVEAGCYAPPSPDASHVARADELATVLDHATPTLARD